MAVLLDGVRRSGGRLFVLGVGGSAANASHAVSDFRKLAGIEAYAPTDNVAELTARTNDEGWDGTFSEWLRGSHLCEKDAILVLSVGGGSVNPAVSMNLVWAVVCAHQAEATVLAIIGKADGHVVRFADACVLVPVTNAERLTPHAEEMQGIVLHLLVSHPLLKQGKMKWESVQ